MALSESSFSSINSEAMQIYCDLEQEQDDPAMVLDCQDDHKHTADCYGPDGPYPGEYGWGFRSVTDNNGQRFSPPLRKSNLVQIAKFLNITALSVS